MMYCAEAFKSREIWIIYNLTLEECQGFNACSVLQRRKWKLLTEQSTEIKGRRDACGDVCTSASNQHGSGPCSLTLKHTVMVEHVCHRQVQDVTVVHMSVNACTPTGTIMKVQQSIPVGSYSFCSLCAL